MAKITRKTQKIFGSNAGATGITEYGSPASGTPVYDTDPDNIQTSDWDIGWSAAALAGSEIPTFQDFNAIHFVATRQIGYLLQEGIPEYDAATEYHTNSIVKKTGTYELYGSKINDNVGNALPSQVDDANWEYLLDLANAGGAGGNVGDIVWTAADTAPSNGILAEGADLSRATYPELFARIGTNYGIGDGTTTFGTPDVRGLFIRGWDDGSGNDPDAASRTDRGDGTTGDNVGTNQADAFEAHSHNAAANNNIITSGGGDGNIPTGSGIRNDNDVETESVGGSETRPVNIAFLPYIIFE